MQRYQHGGGLIEGLVSLVILSVGLLGMAGMQGTLIQESSESRTRMQAGFLASSVLGMAAANPEYVGCFIVNSRPEPAGLTDQRPSMRTASSENQRKNSAA